ncbi:MAG: ATP-dependent Clp protease proteolytic subunit, partial [Anaerolineales bacterium]
MKSLARVCFLLAVVLLALQGVTTIRAQGTAPLAITLIAEGPVTPVMAGYIERGLQIARDQKADIVILQLNTPGGSIDVMERIVAAIRNSPIPIVVYVSPRNAMAGSAGTIITLAGHVAAMAPETTIGAASPVGSQGEDIGETMESKVKEMLKASVRTLTKNRSPEAIKLAEETIEKARAVTADEALEIGLIDLIAADVPDLLNQLDGRKVIVLGEEVALKTRGAVERTVQNTLIEQVLQLLVNPNLVFLLLSIGVQAI